MGSEEGVGRKLKGKSNQKACFVEKKTKNFVVEVRGENIQASFWGQFVGLIENK